MTDLVERLRAWARGNLSSNALGGPGSLMDEAAAEIERLRTEMARHATVCCGEVRWPAEKPGNNVDTGKTLD